jgi:O-antigen/teichoic acid export membrane protein
MINALSKFLKNIGFNMIADFSIRASKSLLLIIVSHFLGVSPMGSLSLALTYLGFGILFSNWGFGNLLTREIARDHNIYNKYIANYGVLRIFFACFAILLINLIIPSLSYTKDTILVIRIISISLIATTIVKLYYSVFIAFEDLKYISVISLIISILRLTASIITILLNGSIVDIAIIYTILEFLSVLVSTIMIVRYLPHLKININIKFAFSEIVRAFPFFWIGVLVMLDTRVEIIILSLYFNEAIVGYYTAVNTVLGGVTLFSEAIRNAVFPIFIQYQQVSSEQLKEIVFLIGKYILIVTLPISILVYFFSSEIITLFFGNGFELSVLMLRITIWLFVTYSLTVVLSGLLMAHDMEKLVAVSLFISGILTLILNIILVPLIGVLGVAFVRLFTSTVMFCICLLFHIKTTGYSIVRNSTGLRILTASLGMYLVTYFLTGINKWIASLSGFILFIFLLLIFRVISAADIIMWKNVVKELFTNTK